MRIATNKFVSVSYDLNVGEGDERELMECATEEHPLEFIVGTGAMLPALEERLKGLSVGDAFDFSIAPEQAFGEYVEDHVVELSKSMFEVDGKFDSERVREGYTLPMIDANGNIVKGSVLEIIDDAVIMDFNHPLAGETLHFTGKVLAVREATADDVAKLNSCGCGCDCDCNSDDCEDGGCSCGCGKC